MMNLITVDYAIQRLNNLIEENINLYDLINGFGINKNNKGKFGLAIEKYIGIRQNTSREPDLVDYELKVIALKELKNGMMVPKEPMCITTINYDELLSHDFHESHLYNKINKMVICYRTNNEAHSKIIKINKINLNDHDNILNSIKEDYYKIKNAYKTYGDIGSNVGAVIQAKTKGQGGPKKNPRERAFYIKKPLIEKLISIK
jgi:hypothetical protein